MKKILIVGISIIIIAALGYLLWWYDDTKIIEKPIDEVMNGKNAFSVIDKEDRVIFIIYDDFIPKTISTFYFKNGVVDHCDFERVHKNKRNARLFLDEPQPNFYNRQLKDNKVIGKFAANVGDSYEGFSQMLIDTYSKIYTKINE